MRRFNKNSKFKRVISMFLACWTFILTLLSSFCVDEISLSADSNDRRMQYIQIANGKRLTDIENYNEIDADSLRAVALYLSNFYVPFSTVLDEDYQNEDNEFRKNMLSALVDSCGVEEDTANFMVNNTIEQTLKSCKQIYVEYDYVKFVNEYLYWRQEALSYGFCLCNNGDKNFDCTATGSIHDRKSLGTGYTMIRNSISYYNKAGIRPTVGFAGNKIYSMTVGSTKEGGLELNPYSHAQFMSKVSSMTSADSEGSTDLKNIGGIAYEPLTYPVFLSLMNFGYNNAILEALPANIRCLVGYGRESVDETVDNNLIEQMKLMTNQAGLSYDEGKESSPLVWGWDKIDESFFDHYYRKVDGKGDNNEG